MRTRFSTVLSFALALSACGGATPEVSSPTPKASSSASAVASAPDAQQTQPAEAPAVDFDPEQNPLGKRHVHTDGMMPLAVVQLFDAEGWRWGGTFGALGKLAFHVIDAAS